MKILDYYAKLWNKKMEESETKLKNILALKKKIGRGTKSIAKSTGNQADEIERANRALTRMEAKYQAILGNSSKAMILEIENEFSKLEEYAKKTGKSIEKLQYLKELYLASESKKVNDSIMGDTIRESGLDFLQVQDRYNKRYDQMKEYYDKVEALQNARESQLQEQRNSGALTEIEYQAEVNALKLQQDQTYYDKKEELDRLYWEGQAMTAGAAMGELAGVLQTFYSTGLIKSKAMLNTMKGLMVGQAIMNTWVAASEALKAPPGPPFSYVYVAAAIAKGMAQVAQIKAQKFHTGGYAAAPNASGNGGKRDDEINAVLQKGEYVLSKTDVQLIKAANKREINSLRNMKEQVPETNKSESSSKQTRELSMLAESLKPEVVIVNSMDPSVVEDWATSRRGREIINNVVNA